MKQPSPATGDDSLNRPANEPKFARSRQMTDCLRSAFLYSEKRARDLVFAALERVTTERPPVMVTRLTRDAALLAPDLAAESGFDFDNWDLASKSVIRAMLMAGALRTPEGKPIPFGIAAQATIVGGLCAEYRDVTEAFLLEFLIHRLGDVTTRDHTALAHALFRQFDPKILLEELEDRVVVLLARLSDRAVLSGDTYRIREFEQA